MTLPRSLRLVFAFAFCAAAPLAAAAKTKLLRFPDICNDRVVFTYGGDLWTMSAQGGTAIRLTAGPGLQESAKFSPDCNQIAFTGGYSGEDQVYVMPIAGVGKYSPVGKQLVYSPLSRDFLTWDRYQGGRAQDLYIFDMATQQGRNITNNPRTDCDPI